MQRKQKYIGKRHFGGPSKIRNCPLYASPTKTGIDQEQLSRFMREQRGLSIKTAEQLAAIVGLRLEGGAK